MGFPSASSSAAKFFISLLFIFSKEKSPPKRGIASVKLNSPSPLPVHDSPASATNEAGTLIISSAFDKLVIGSAPTTLRTGLTSSL